MHSQTKQLEATAELDLPPSTWADILSAADQLISLVFPAACVALLVANDQRIRKLNCDWRQQDRATDVLSWPAGRTSEGFAGDIAISWDAVRRQAQKHNHSEAVEATALFAHGLLHLAGHDHLTAEAQFAMDALTLELLHHVGIEVKSFGH